MKLDEIRNRLADVMERLESLSEKEKLGEQEEREFDSLLVESESLVNSICNHTGEQSPRFDNIAYVNRYQKFSEVKTWVEQPQARSFDPRAANMPQHNRIPGDVGVKTAAKGQGYNYRSLFGYGGHKQLDSGGFHSFREFLEVLESGKHDPRLAGLDARQLNTGDGSAGGFTVPTMYAADLLDSVLSESVVLPRATVHSLEAPTKEIALWDDLDLQTGHPFGGLEGRWVGELEENTEQHPQLRQLTLSASKLAIYTSASREVLMDGQELEKGLMYAMRNAMNWYLDKAFLTGTGGSQPLGIINGPSKLEVSREEANQIKYADLVAMYAKLIKGGRPVWIVSHDTIPELMTMETSGNNLIWQPNAREGAPGQLLGIPVLVSDHLAALGTKADVILADLSKYQVGLREQLILDSDQGVGPGWSRDYVSFRSIIRVDGSDPWDQPLKLPNGGEMSWVVVLDAA